MVSLAKDLAEEGSLTVQVTCKILYFGSNFPKTDHEYTLSIFFNMQHGTHSNLWAFLNFLMFIQSSLKKNRQINISILNAFNWTWNTCVNQYVLIGTERQGSINFKKLAHSGEHKKIFYQFLHPELKADTSEAVSFYIIFE